MKKTKVFSLSDFHNMLDDAKENKTIAAIILIVLAQWKNKQSSDICVAAVLRNCADWIEKHI